MNNQKILIITAVFFPRLVPRAHRATELAKELSREGHDVTVCAVLGEYDYTDFCKATGVKVVDLGMSPFEWKNSDVEQPPIALWKKGLAFILGKFLLFPYCLIGLRIRKYLKKSESFDRIISVAIPYPVHFGTGYAKRHYAHLKSSVWISDCGDPFTLNPHSRYPFYFKWIEKKWCRTTDFISVPTPLAIQGYYPEFRDKIRVIPQGFRFDEVKLAEYKCNDVPTFAYSGMVYPQKRDPRKFLDYLVSLDKEFKFIVYTNHQELFLPYKEQLKEKLEFRNYVPREQLLYELSKMDFLIDIKNESAVQLPSKLIDYYQTKRPILEITSAFDEREQFDAFCLGNYESQLVIENPQQYDITNVCHEFL